ncbi:MAG: hypothetical protein ABL933_13325 [Methyloglobulus sp.]
MTGQVPKFLPQFDKRQKRLRHYVVDAIADYKMIGEGDNTVCFRAAKILMYY